MKAGSLGKARSDTAIGTPDLSGSNPRRLHTCRMNPAFLADAASCIGGSVRVRPTNVNGFEFAWDGNFSYCYRI